MIRADFRVISFLRTLREPVFNQVILFLTYLGNSQVITAGPLCLHCWRVCPAGGCGANAGPAVDISGKIEEGSASVTDQQIADIQAVKRYVNIHTAKYPDGEIRGQVEPAK